jgi:hypothetical protein
MKRSSSVGMFYLWTFLIITALLVMTSCGTSKHLNTVSWEDSIENPENKEFVLEVAFNEGIEVSAVTQAMFNARYK